MLRQIMPTTGTHSSLRYSIRRNWAMLTTTIQTPSALQCSSIKSNSGERNKKLCNSNGCPCIHSISSRWRIICRQMRINRKRGLRGILIPENSRSPFRPRLMSKVPLALTDKAPTAHNRICTSIAHMRMTGLPSSNRWARGQRAARVVHRTAAPQAEPLRWTPLPLSMIRICPHILTLRIRLASGVIATMTTGKACDRIRTTCASKLGSSRLKAKIT